MSTWPRWATVMGSYGSYAPMSYLSFHCNPIWYSNQLPLRMQKGQDILCRLLLLPRLLFILLIDFIHDLLKLGNRPVYGRGDVHPDALHARAWCDNRTQHLRQPCLLQIHAKTDHSNAVPVHAQCLHCVPPVPDHKWSGHKVRQERRGDCPHYYRTPFRQAGPRGWNGPHCLLWFSYVSSLGEMTGVTISDEPAV